MPSPKIVLPEVKVDEIVFYRAKDARMVNDQSLFLGHVNYSVVVIGLLAGGADLVIELKNAQLRENVDGAFCMVPGKRVTGGAGDLDLDALLAELKSAHDALQEGDADELAKHQLAAMKIIAEVGAITRRNAWYTEGATKVLIEAELLKHRGIAGALKRAQELREIENKPEETPSS